VIAAARIQSCIKPALWDVLSVGFLAVNSESRTSALGRKQASNPTLAPIDPALSAIFSIATTPATHHISATLLVAVMAPPATNEPKTVLNE